MKYFVFAHSFSSLPSSVSTKPLVLPNKSLVCVCEYMCDTLHLIRTICLSMGGKLFRNIVNAAVATLLKKMIPHLPAIINHQ